jgi:hypothetical protein
MRALVEPAAAAVRDITRPAPCTVLNSPSRWALRISSLAFASSVPCR